MRILARRRSEPWSVGPRPWRTRQLSMIEDVAPPPTVALRRPGGKPACDQAQGCLSTLVYGFEAARIVTEEGAIGGQNGRVE